MTAERLVLTLSLEPGDALAGSLASDLGEEVMEFSGWFGLLESLDVLRRRLALTAKRDAAHEPVPPNQEAAKDSPS